MAHICNVVGELPAGYGDISYAWFPTNEACEQYGMPSFEGYLSLHDAINNYPESLVSGDEQEEPMWEILPVTAVEDCTVYV